jgi:CDP-L-myo-inositol myo-inositolphosphotransferase
VTVASFFIGVIGAVFFSLGRYEFFIVGGICTQLSSIVDCADGMLARKKNMSSDYGAYLDLFLDRINEFFIMTGYAAGLYISSGNLTQLILIGIAISLYYLQVTLFYITKKYLRNDKTGETAEVRALLLFLIFVFAVTNRLDLGVYTLLGSVVGVNIYSVVKFINLRGKARPSL